MLLHSAIEDAQEDSDIEIELFTKPLAVLDSKLRSKKELKVSEDGGFL